MKKLTRKQAYFIGIFIISLLMTAVMSLGMILIRQGFTDRFWIHWRNDFAVGCCIAIPAGYVLVPLVEKVMSYVSK
jgi:hypothetical protein